MARREIIYRDEYGETRRDELIGIFNTKESGRVYGIKARMQLQPLTLIPEIDVYKELVFRR